MYAIHDITGYSPGSLLRDSRSSSPSCTSIIQACHIFIFSCRRSQSSNRMPSSSVIYSPQALEPIKQCTGLRALSLASNGSLDDSVAGILVAFKDLMVSMVVRERIQGAGSCVLSPFVFCTGYVNWSWLLSIQVK
jgi:hypothetical protein